MRIASRALLLLTVAVVASCTGGPDPAPVNEVSLRVDMARVIQDDFLGVNGTYHGFAWMPEQLAKGMSDADRARELDRVEACGLNLARTWYRPDWACGESLYDEPDWDSAKMRAFYKWLDAMQARNVGVALQTGWWFSQDTYLGGTEPHPATDPERYAGWVSQSVHQLVEVRGYDIEYLILFTEPTTSFTGSAPEDKSEWKYYADVVTAIHRRLEADGRRGLVKLVGPNNARQAQHLAAAARDLDDKLDVYSGHDYNLDSYANWYALCASMQERVATTNKPVWLDEFGDKNHKYRQLADYGTYIAEAVAASLNTGNQTSFIWLLFDQQYPAPLDSLTNGDSFVEGVHRWGTCKWPRDTQANPTQPYPHWYSFALMSKYLGGRDSTRVYSTMGAEQVHIAAVQRSSGDWSFLVVNASLQDEAIAVELSAPLKRTVYRYLYDPASVKPTEAAELPGISKTFPGVQKSFRDMIPARGVAVYSTLGEKR